MLGDSYVSFGRGLALSIRKIDEFGVDTTLRGAKLLLHRGALDGTLVVGASNIQNIDEATGRSTHDPNDLIVGAQAQVTNGPLTTGLHFAAVAFKEGMSGVEASEFNDRYYHVGTSLDVPQLGRHLGFYFESLVQVRDAELQEADNLGTAAYASGVVYAGPAAVLLEGKAYGDIAVMKPNIGRPEFASIAYSNPPTAERVLQVLENPQSEIYGGRIRIDWALSRDFVFYTNYGAFRDALGYADPSAIGMRRRGTIHDPYVGLELRWNSSRSHAFLSGGWRGVRLAGSNETVRAEGHVEIDLAQAVGADASVECHGLHSERRKNESPILDEAFREGSWSLGLQFHNWTLAGGYDYTTERVHPKRNYFNANLVWKVSASSTIRLLAGAARGGLKCVSGVCRTFPPFEGAKLSIALRF
ncbi:MAG TPA: DUF6029 family protein [Polyangiaceae bacterium]|nr:DUF6029 family protein [Polyangiaceae bacterium]